LSGFAAAGCDASNAAVRMIRETRIFLSSFRTWNWD
jgi:hypothetical protein